MSGLQDNPKETKTHETRHQLGSGYPEWSKTVLHHSSRVARHEYHFLQDSQGSRLRRGYDVNSKRELVTGRETRVASRAATSGRFRKARLCEARFGGAVSCHQSPWFHATPHQCHIYPTAYPTGSQSSHICVLWPIQLGRQVRGSTVTAWKLKLSGGVFGRS